MVCIINGIKTMAIAMKKSMPKYNRNVGTHRGQHFSYSWSNLCVNGVSWKTAPFTNPAMSFFLRLHLKWQVKWLYAVMKMNWIFYEHRNWNLLNKHNGKLKHGVSCYISKRKTFHSEQIVSFTIKIMFWYFAQISEKHGCFQQIQEQLISSFPFPNPCS